MASHLLGNHVDRVLDATVRYDRNDRSINEAQVVDAKDTELAINNTMIDVLAYARAATGVCIARRQFSSPPKSE